MAGIAAAMSNNGIGVAGMNWNTPVYICRTLDASGNGTSSSFASALEEIVDYAVAHSLRVVINYSGGGPANMTKQNACKYASDHGMILCAAAGNDNGGPIIWPAAYSSMFDGVIAVGSTDSNDSVSSFSNVGAELNVVAPGRSILSTTPTYSTVSGVSLNFDTFDGTSMATPFVTGLCALMWSRHASFSNKKIRQCLQDSAVKLGTGTFSNAWGFGRISARAALECGDFIWPPFTDFTRFTKFTRFTLFTPFTRFTRFTVGPDPGPLETRPFIRFGGTIFSQEELTIERFEPLSAISGDLRRAGLDRIDIVAGAEPSLLARKLDWPDSEVAKLISLAQQLMQALIKPE